MMLWTLAGLSFTVASFSYLDMSAKEEGPSLIGVQCQARILENEILHHSETRGVGKNSHSWDIRTSRLTVGYEFQGRKLVQQRTLDYEVRLPKESKISLQVDPHYPDHWEFTKGQGIEPPPPVNHFNKSKLVLFCALGLAAFAAGTFAVGWLVPEQEPGRHFRTLDD